MTVAAIFLVVVLAGVGVAFAFISNIDRNLQDGLDEDLLASLTASDSPSEPFYMLLIGVDKSEEREESDIYGGAYRTDSMILTRVDPRNTKITMVSIYRDTMVETARLWQTEDQCGVCFRWSLTRGQNSIEAGGCADPSLRRNRFQWL